MTDFMALDSAALAQKIEDELGSLYVAKGKGPLPDLGKADREMLFSAIAQAIVDHLENNAEVEVKDPTWSNPVMGVIK
jgi:hypothetical protein